MRIFIVSGNTDTLKTLYIRKAVPVVLYYIAGYFLTWLVSELEKPHYAHGPNLFHLIALLFFAGGFLWAITNSLQVYAGKREYALSLLVNLCVIGGILLYFFISI
jgi:hypothetical protein